MAGSNPTLSLNKQMDPANVNVLVDYGVYLSRVPKVPAGTVKLGADGDGLLANLSSGDWAGEVVDLWVDDHTPPTFLWHTSDDNGVPVQNSLLFSAALAEHHIPFECHIYPHGAHGLSLCDQRTWADNPGLLSPTAAPWIDLAIRWAREL
jgi:acetyl esterase/lipase